MFNLQVMPEKLAGSLEADQNPPTYAPQLSVVVQGAGDLQAGRNMA